MPNNYHVANVANVAAFFRSFFFKNFFKKNAPVSLQEHPNITNILKSNKITEKEIPTHSEIDIIKVNLILNNVQKSKEDLNKYIKIIENNKNKNFTDLELAAALLKRMREN